MRVSSVDVTRVIGFSFLSFRRPDEPDWLLAFLRGALAAVSPSLVGREFTISEAAAMWRVRPCRVRRYLERGVVPASADGTICRDLDGKRLRPIEGIPQAKFVEFWYQGGGCGLVRSMRQFARMVGDSVSGVHRQLKRGVLSAEWRLGAVRYNGRWLYRY
jgi:hypothetical protein